jgi:hypothetical protein
LDATDRGALAEELLLSITPADRDRIDAAWLAEARRRDESLRNGTTSARPVDEVIERLRHRTIP